MPFASYRAITRPPATMLLHAANSIRRLSEIGERQSTVELCVGLFTNNATIGDEYIGPQYAWYAAGFPLMKFTLFPTVIGDCTSSPLLPPKAKAGWMLLNSIRTSIPAFTTRICIGVSSVVARRT